MIEEKREFLIKYSDEEGKTCYSEPFTNPEAVIVHYNKYFNGSEGIIIKRITKEERFDDESYIKGLIAQKKQIENTLKKLGYEI